MKVKSKEDQVDKVVLVLVDSTTCITLEPALDSAERLTADLEQDKEKESGRTKTSLKEAKMSKKKTAIFT